MILSLSRNVLFLTFYLIPFGALIPSLSITFYEKPFGAKCDLRFKYTEAGIEGHAEVRTKEKEIDVSAGQAILIEAGEWVQYSTPYPEGAEYIAVCLPAFSPEIVHRDA
ncbi:MAG: cupin domain-containing protein [Methanotrichaceae archaeon]